MQKLIGVARDALFAKIRFPFIEQLVQLVTLGAVSVDTSFSVIDALMLLCAVPATIAYKLVTGEAPLSAGEVIAFPYGSVTVQSGTDVVRRFSWIGGLTGAFVKLVISAYQTYNKAQASISGVPVDPAKAWQSWLAAAFGSVGVGAEVIGRHTTKTTPVPEVEWTMVAISGLLNAKTYALLIAQRRGGDQEQLEKVNAGIDVAGYIIHLVLRTTVYGVIIDADRQSSQAADRAEQLPETLAWMEALFDQAGSALISGSALDDDPETKAILLGTGALAGKGFAFVLDLVRSVTSIAAGQLQTN
jgi:hypothetical protein